MKPNAKRRVAVAVVAALIAVTAWAGVATAATTYADYAVFGEYGVMIGGGSQVNGNVGARFNNDDNSNAAPPPAYPGQPRQALNMNGGAKILGTANIGQAASSADASVANGVTVTQLNYVDTFSHGSSFVGTATQLPGGTDLPAGSLATQSVWPGGLGSNCVGGPNYTGLSNGFNLTLTPASYGNIQGGGGGDLTFNGAGDYYITSLRAGNGLEIHVPTPGVRVFVCGYVLLGGGADVLPTSLVPADFIMEVAGINVTAGTNAFTAAAGSDWIGNLLVPTRGVHYGGSAGPTTWIGYMWAGHIDIEHGVHVTPPTEEDQHKKSGYKFNDLDGNHVWDGNEPGLNGWLITVWDATQTNIVAQDVTHDDSSNNPGYYEFVLLDGVTYVVCETGQAGWSQTFPESGPANVVACTNEGTLGYQVTLNGADETRNDFGNHFEEVPWCEKGPVQEVLDPTTGQYPGNDGPDVVVRVDLNESVQDAVDNTGDANNDGYIIIGVSAHVDGSLGGSANQKVAVSMDYTETLPFALIGCSVTLTGGGSDPAVWVKDTANAKNITVNGRTTDIFVMDLHGADSAVGVQADGQWRYLRNEDGVDSGIGIKVVGDNNTIHNGAAEGNTGDGVYVQGNGNKLTDADSFDNGGNGFNVVGDSNQLLKLDAGDRNKGNTADGIHVAGKGNTISENDAFANGGDGFDVAGGTAASPNVLKKNTAGDTGDKANLGNGFRVAGTGSGTSNPIELEENVAEGNSLVGFLVTGTGHELKKNEGTNNGGFEFDVAAGNFNAEENEANGNTIAGNDGDPFPTGGIES